MNEIEGKRPKSCEQCALVRDLATKIENRELFNRLSKHLNILAAEVEKAIAGDPDDNELKRA